MTLIKVWNLLLLWVAVASSKRSHECTRPCDGTTQMDCKYTFNVETFKTRDENYCNSCEPDDCNNKGCITVDGSSRIGYIVNRQIPGPTINVCEGDTIIVNVKNKLINGQGITIHWHGQFQSKSQWMDGVPMVTQCPIPLMSSMQYKFKADPSGTHWWHAHVGLQRGDGFFGAIVVRENRKTETHSALYDTDEESNVIIINDWFHQFAVEQYDDHRHGETKTFGLLINGKGGSKSSHDANDKIPKHLTTFEVAANSKHRFRLINAATSICPLEISIDDHPLSVIASDGRNIQPVPVDSLNSMNGERYDFIINTNQTKGVYAIRIKGFEECRGHEGIALLKYKNYNGDGTIPTSSEKDSVSVLNPYNMTDPRTKTTISEMKSTNITEHVPHNIETANKTFYFKLGFGHVVTKPSKFIAAHTTTVAYINNYSWVWPDLPIMFKSKHLNPQKFCYPANTNEHVNTEIKQCVHRVKIPSNLTVDFVVYTDQGSHPMHLHGGYYAVVAQIKLTGNATEENIKGLYKTALESGQFNLKNPPVKDTTIAHGNYLTVFRFNTWNPGYWLFHCHIAFHFEMGMGLVVDVGEDSEWKAPPAGFPDKCKSYLGSN